MYVHFWYLDIEQCACTYEVVLGPLSDNVQLTYDCLRNTDTGSTIARYEHRVMGAWMLPDDHRPFSDITFSEDYPPSVVG